MAVNQQAAGDKRVFWIVVVCCLLICALIVTSRALKTKSPASRITIGRNVTLNVDIADSDPERERGFSGHPPISESEGMLFTFPSPILQTFWMNKMLFDLDFIYLRNNAVIYLVEQVKAPINTGGRVEYINAPEPFDAVLEVQSGFIKKKGIKLGDTLKLET